jgi:hypothetical protein
MEQYQGRARATLVVPRPHSVEVYIGRHSGDALLKLDFESDAAPVTTAARLDGVR